MDEINNNSSGGLNDEDEAVPLLFNIPVGTSSRYAHHMMIQASENEVTLSFFELFPPLVLDPAMQKQEAKKGVRADCVARVTIAKGRYPEFVKALLGVLEQSETKK